MRLMPRLGALVVAMMAFAMISQSTATAYPIYGGFTPIQWDGGSPPKYKMTRIAYDADPADPAAWWSTILFSEVNGSTGNGVYSWWSFDWRQDWRWNPPQGTWVPTNTSWNQFYTTFYNSTWLSGNLNPGDFNSYYHPTSDSIVVLQLRHSYPGVTKCTQAHHRVVWFQPSEYPANWTPWGTSGQVGPDGILRNFGDYNC